MRLSDVFCFVVLCSVSTADSADLIAESLKDCDKNQLTMNLCARHFYDIANKELNGLFKQQLTMLETAEGKMRIRNAQRAWVAFRDAACDAEAYPNEGGSMQPMVYSYCLARLTDQRRADLISFSSTY